MKLDKIKKFWFVILAILLSVQVFALQVNEVSNLPNSTKDSSHSIFTIIIFGLLLVLVGVIFIGGFILLVVWLMTKFMKLFSDFQRANEDFFYKKFLQECELCHYGRDSQLIKRNWKMLWLFFKRTPILIKTNDNKIKCIGYYNGESTKIMGLTFIAFTNKVSMFKNKESILIIPQLIEKNIIKFYANDRKNIMIECEGIDEINNTDYFFQPLIISPQDNAKKREFIDLYNLMVKDYFEPTNYKEVIKESLDNYKEGIAKASKMNPHGQLHKKNPE